jgi:hypothetical protein
VTEVLIASFVVSGFLSLELRSAHAFFESKFPTGVDFRALLTSLVYPELRTGRKFENRGESVAVVADRDHEQLFQSFAYQLVGEIGPVVDQRGDDLSRIG